ncbi:MAG: hypothetical protein ACQEVA_22065 [Myxococcota bacterium]
MYRKLVLCLLLSAGISAPATVMAQEYGPEDTSSVKRPEKPEKDEDEEEEDLRLEFGITSEYHAGDNADFRPLDESSEEARLDSDDRYRLGYTSLSGDIEYDVVDDVTVGIGAIHSGLWGSDQIGSINAFMNFLYFYKLNIQWDIVDAPGLKLSTTLGRQSFEIGGADDDFFLKDILDAATITAEGPEQVGTLRILALDVFTGGRPDLNFSRYLSGQDQVQNFRGETATLRTGAVYENTGLVDGLEMRAFGFYADIGSQGSGSNRTYGGRTGNFTDNDYNWMAGTRIGYTFETDDFELGGYGEYARSGGLDRRNEREGEYNITADGNAFGAAITGEVNLGESTLDIAGQYFYADGGNYTETQGIQYNHGFVGFKGSQAGGLAADRSLGWHPSAYTGWGIENSPHDQARKSGTQVIHGGLGWDFDDMIGLDLDAWYFIDNNDTNFDTSQANAVAQAGNLPTGYTAAELEAQERFGRHLGTEFDAALSYSPNDVLTVYALGTLFIPGDFYEIEIDAIAGDQLGAPNSDPEQLRNYWSLVGGATVNF